MLDFVDRDGAATLDLQRRYLYGEAVDQILAQEDISQLFNSADRVLWPLTDNLGTVRDLARNDASIATHFTYNAFGNITSGNTSLTRYLFTSREFDPDTNLQYNRARYYDATTGCWLSHDPLSFAAGDTNTYRYVGNSVTNATDPSGLQQDGVDDTEQFAGDVEIRRAPPTNTAPPPFRYKREYFEEKVELNIKVGFVLEKKPLKPGEYRDNVATPGTFDPDRKKREAGGGAEEFGKWSQDAIKKVGREIISPPARAFIKDKIDDIKRRFGGGRDTTEENANLTPEKPMSTAKKIIKWIIENIKIGVGKDGINAGAEGTF